MSYDSFLIDVNYVSICQHLCNYLYITQHSCFYRCVSYMILSVTNLYDLMWHLQFIGVCSMLSDNSICVYSYILCIFVYLLYVPFTFTVEHLRIYLLMRHVVLSCFPWSNIVWHVVLRPNLFLYLMFGVVQYMLANQSKGAQTGIAMILVVAKQARKAIVIVFF